jgi:flagellin
MGARAQDQRLLNVQRRQSERSAKARARLSTGARINRAADDAAGLAVSVKIGHRVTAYAQAQINAREAAGYLETKESFIAEGIDMLHRMRVLAVRASNDTMQDDERAHMDTELTQLKASYTQMLEGRYNTHRLFAEVGGPSGVANTFLVGIEHSQGAYITLKDDTIKKNWQTKINRIRVHKANAATGSLTHVQALLSHLSLNRAALGSVVARLEDAAGGIATAIEQGTVSEGRIRDADIAESVSELTKVDIVSQASLALMTQVQDVRRMQLSLL